jgi:hypothetical protein
MEFDVIFSTPRENKYRQRPVAVGRPSGKQRSSPLAGLYSRQSFIESYRAS